MDELRLCLVTDRAQVRGRDLVGVVVECLAAGLPAVQVREKDLPAAELAALCALLIVNDRVDVALAVGADAVQRTHSSLAVAEIREIVDKRLRIGASTHAPEEALSAEAEGADWIVFGPIYDTPSKQRFGAPQGLRALERVAAAVRTPVIAIGGITPERVPEVRRAGAHGVAVISALLTADSPGDATKRFLDALSR